MFFYISGEGNSDLGSGCDHEGPLMSAIFKISENVTSESFYYEYISKSQLSLAVKNQTPKRGAAARGKKRFPEHLYIERCAYALAIMAQPEDGSDIGVIYFRDCDFTNKVSEDNTYYEAEIKAMEKGFHAANGYGFGVPMVPKMRSECWFLGHYQANPYQNCSQFESLPANDNSPHSPKKKLAEFFDCNENDIYRIHVRGEDVEWLRIDASSFIFFRNRFEHVIYKLISRSSPHNENDTLKSRGIYEQV